MGRSWPLVQFIGTYSKQGSILESYWKNQFFESYSKKVGSILWAMFKKKVQFLWVMLKRKKDSILWVIVKRRVQVCESYWKEGFKSVSQIEKGSIKNSILWVMFKKGSIIWPLWKKKFNSLRHIKKSILRVFLRRKVHFLKSFFWKRFNSLSHININKKGSILGVIFKKVSMLRKNLWITIKKSSILWVTFNKKD